jgi:hypothetical protein
MFVAHLSPAIHHRPSSGARGQPCRSTRRRRLRFKARVGRCLAQPVRGMVCCAVQGGRRHSAEVADGSEAETSAGLCAELMLVQNRFTCLMQGNSPAANQALARRLLISAFNLVSRSRWNTRRFLRLVVRECLKANDATRQRHL